MANNRVNRYLEKQSLNTFCQLLADTEDPEKIAEIISDLGSPELLLDLAKRLAAATYLEKGRSYADIKFNLQLSATEIAEVAQNLANPGLQLALREVRAEQWADHWTKQITSFFKRR
jgi:uncharacterized protein YerC